MTAGTTAEALDARAIATVDLDAIEHNCRILKRQLGASMLCAVVKANGYGHGAFESARAALSSGAEWLAVVSATEAADLRARGVTARLLVMGAFTDSSAAVALGADADLVVWRDDQVDVVLAAGHGAARLHVKLDTGMGRLGTREASQARALAARVAADERLELAGFMTHFATADEPGSELFIRQLEVFRQVAALVKADHPGCVVHAANSAAVLHAPDSHFDMARCGIAIYGLDPFQRDPSDYDLRPALSLSSYVADIKQIAAGDSVGYGATWTASEATHIGVLPIGYGDGFRRGLSNRAEVLIEGVRRPVVGTVSMDNITVDLGRAPEFGIGAPAAVIGEQGAERLLAEDMARALGTINYEITCGISARVPRVYGGAAAA